MQTSDITALANTIVSVAIVFALAFYRRKDANHRPAVSWLAYLIVLVYASVIFRYLVGEYHQSHWAVVTVNIIICAAVLRARGNVARLLDLSRL